MWVIIVSNYTGISIQMNSIDTHKTSRLEKGKKHNNKPDSS